MARSANLLKKTPKKKSPGTNRATQAIFAGSEPGPFKDSHFASDFDRIKLVNWYNTNCDQSDYQKWTVIWCKKNGYTKSEISKVQSASKALFNSSWASLARMNDRGFSLSPESLEFMKSRISNLISTQQDEKESSIEVEFLKKSPASIVKRKTEDMISSLEEVVDQWEKNADYSLYDNLVKNEVAGPTATKILEYYTPLLNELKELIDQKSPDLVESYSHLSVQKRKKYLAFIENIVNDAIQYTNRKKAVRKTRTLRPISTEKIVSKVSYKKEDSEYKLTSIDPINIIGASVLFVFNTKYRELRMYVASSEMGIRVKSTTLIDYDEVKSLRKKVRNPEKALMPFLKSTKIHAQKAFDEIKTTAATANGRINGDCIILRAIK